MRKLKGSELNRKTLSEFKNASKTPLSLILDDIRSSNNIGSVFRSADAFLIEKIYLCGICSQPPHRDIHKTALGATETVNWQYVPDIERLVERLLAEGVRVYAIEQTEGAMCLNQFMPEKNTRYAFILGHEIKGVKQSVINSVRNAIEIPQFGTKNSLNISIAAGIVIWDFFTKYQRL